ncbi:S8 family serine peptidase, partial [Candidatus Bipolaricaulota bacterium]|nr:S8 family serine peptidase [Candidatus Bipolaricaulota bacterium]
LDYSVPAIGADQLHSAVPPLTGEGVIIGSVDTGIDYSHLDFRYDSDGDGIEESSRIFSIWDQTSSSLGAYYGNDEIESDIALGLGPESGQVRQADTNGHGTHLMGIAAGDGSSSDTGLIGVAPDATIVMVKTSFYTSDIISGVRYIFEQAAMLGLPAVVNLSLGGHEGPHDGTSLFEQGLSELAQQYGQTIVVSAGNEGDANIHVGQELHGNSFTFTINPVSPLLELQLWYPGESSFSLTVTPPVGSSLTVDRGNYASSQAENLYVDNASDGTNPNNGDNEIQVSLIGVTPGSNWSFTITDEGGGGRFDGWIITNTGATILEGDTRCTIDEPGNAYGVITVGSFNTKELPDFPTENGIGEISYFSSRGPTRDGRQKPELTAPGAWIAAALSSNSFREGLPDPMHTLLRGTSFSAAHVSGVIALMLSYNPQLINEEIRMKLMETSASDAFTGLIPNTSWGYGKANAYEAVTSIYDPEESETYSPTVTVSSNPVSNRALFTYTLPEGATQATLQVYNIVGALLFQQEVDPESSQYEWDLIDSLGRLLANGLYLYTIMAEGNSSEIGRLVIIR